MRDAGGQAFPLAFVTRDGDGKGIVNVEDGMSLRDYFAAQAMTGAQVWDAVLNGKHASFAQGDGCARLAQIAYEVADAMLAERSK